MENRDNEFARLLWESVCETEKDENERKAWLYDMISKVWTSEEDKEYFTERLNEIK